MVPEPSLPHTPLLLHGLSEAFPSACHRGWERVVWGGPRSALREYKGDLAGLAYLSPASSTPPWVWAVCSACAGHPSPASHRPTVAHRPGNICAPGIQGRYFMVVELVAALAAWKPFLWGWGCSGKWFPRSRHHAKFPVPRSGFHLCCL